MKPFLLRGTAVALILSASAQAALADLSVQDVWSDWRDYVTGMGYQLSASESVSGGTLTVSDLTMAMTLPEDGGVLSVGLGPLVFREDGDGGVTLDMPPSMPMRIQVTGGEEEIDASFSLTQTDASLKVTGSPEDMMQLYRAGSAALVYDHMSVDGKALPPEALRAQVALSDFESRNRVRKSGADRSYDQSGAAASLSYDIAFASPNGEDSGHFSGTMQDLSFDGQSVIPAASSGKELGDMLGAGFSVDGRFGFGSGNSQGGGKSEGEEFMMSSTSAGGSVAVKMDATNLVYDVTQMQPQISLQTNDLPFPISVAMETIGFRLDMPVARAAEDQPFGLGLKLIDFTMPDQLWSIFDPSAVLPRDPATIVVDLAGTAKLLVDLFDPALAEAEEAPAELTGLTIRDLHVAAVGTDLTAKGDFTFDNSRSEEFGGMPAPVGAADLRLAGGNGLLDKLIEMGLMTDQDAMGARMMMGMIGVPGDGPDTLTSHIEVNDQGQVFANGQRLK
ncbi:DUF2125 domain-containing protein [Pseudodonghicola flavimaris]|uniref:DUF2125 domain-containing protein n=1 Tax=Pseudodonghicola flavimaris TaxID=3050036 RepID=A0ABT7EZP6_9RHOB|nr:DUF2125 domain-containing protein [Pseudodonghicola flavimaris]MDK3017714.1 DUF2125 domain-containing protein [Pseudodonghicola flavimaris]